LSHLMVTNPFIRLDAVRSAIRGIGQALERRRGAYLAQQSPAFLRPLEQRYDPLVVNETTAWTCLASRHKKPVKWVKDYFLWYIFAAREAS